MRKNRNEEYDWINDPFDEKKLAQEREQARMSSGSKVGICLLYTSVCGPVCFCPTFYPLASAFYCFFTCRNSSLVCLARFFTYKCFKTSGNFILDMPFKSFY